MSDAGQGVPTMINISQIRSGLRVGLYLKVSQLCGPRVTGPMETVSAGATLTSANGTRKLHPPDLARTSHIYPPDVKPTIWASRDTHCVRIFGLQYPPSPKLPGVDVVEESSSGASEAQGIRW